MNRPAYDEVSRLWEIEGSLRDIYILQTGIEDWKTFLTFASDYSCFYSFDGQARALPDVEQIFSNRDGSHLLRIRLGEVTANCHFFVASEIELDLDPKEVQNLGAHEEALSFIEGLGSAVGKPVLLTPENGSGIPFLSFEPTGKWQAHP